MNQDSKRLQDKSKEAGLLRYWVATWVAVSVVALAFIYAPFLNAPFVFDSTLHIELADDVVSRIEPAKWLTERRPVALLTIAIDQAIYGLGLRWGFALTNLLIHWLAGTLIFLLVWQTFHLAGAFERNEASPHRGLPFAFLIAILWLIHPLQVQCVLYHVQRMESLMALFMVASLLCLCQWMKGNSWLWLLGMLAMVFLSCKSKEVGYVSPLVLLIYFFTFSENVHSKNRLSRIVKVMNSMRWASWLAAAGVVLVWAVVAYRFYSENSMGLDEDGQRIYKSMRYFSSQPGSDLFLPEACTGTVWTKH